MSFDLGNFIAYYVELKKECTRIQLGLIYSLNVKMSESWFTLKRVEKENHSKNLQMSHETESSF